MTDQTEGEPQTAFMLPSSGGSYVRNPDGSLTLTEPPTAPAVESSAPQPE